MTEQPSLFAVKPIITYPREAQVGKTYLMTIDLQPEEGFEWQYEEEEYPIYCTVDSNLFSSKPVGEPVVVLHRFGGSYGEAKFLLTAAQELQQGKIDIMLINRYGVPVKTLTLENLYLLEEIEHFPGILQDIQLTPATFSTDLIQELSELIAENLQSTPNASVADLVERLKANKRIIQISSRDALSFQALVEEGGTTNIGNYLRNFDEDKLDRVLKSFWKSLQLAEIPNNVPRSGVAKFIGREAELEQLHVQLQQNSLIAISSIEGMGGVGKTELAIQYAQQYASFYEGGICWLFSREFNVGTQVVSFAQAQLSLKIPKGLELPDQVAFCWRNWTEGEVLLVLDDVVNYPRDVEPYLPPPASNRFKVVITTRCRFAPPIQSLSLDMLSPEQSLELLAILTGEERIQQDLEAAKLLCQWLEYMPLGIEQVGRYLVIRSDLSLSTLLFRLQEKAKKGQAIKHNALQRDEVTATSTARRGVEAAFELSWDELDETSQHLGRLLSLFAPVPISWSLIQAVEQSYYETFNESKEFDSEEFGRARTRLLDLHLLQLSQQQEQVYKLHSLIREFFIGKREEDKSADVLKQSFCAEMLIVAKQIPQTPTLSLIQQVFPKIPHLVEAVTALGGVLTDEDLIIILTRIAWFYQGQVAYKEAEQWYVRCLEISEERLGNNHPNVAVSLNNLAALYEFQGRYSESEPLFVRSLSILEQQLSNDHPEIASSLNNLAELYRSQGRYRDAEPLYIRSLSIRQQQLGVHHPETATSLNNLAGLYYAMGRYSDAEPLMVQALSVRRQYLGDDHPNTATSFNNLALLYQTVGRFSDAESLCLRSLEIRQQLLGRNHPSTAASLSTLAGLYYGMGRYFDAEPLMCQALDIYWKQLGEEHPDTASTLNNLAGLYCAMNRYNDAKPLYERALNIHERLLGMSHPNTISTRENLVSLYRSMELNSQLTENTNDITFPPLDAVPEKHGPHLGDSFDSVASLTATAIVMLAFQTFLESAADELAKGFTDNAIRKMGELRQRIYEKLQNKGAEAMLASIEEGATEDLERVAAYLEVVMTADSQFTSEIYTLAQQISTGRLQDNSSMIQINRDNARGWQTNVEGGTAYIGEINIHR